MMRLEFGNEEHIQFAREAEEEAARREAGIRRWRVGFVVSYGGYVEVEAPTGREARRLVEGGKVDVEADDWEGLEVVSVEPVCSSPPGPEQPVFPFISDAGESRELLPPVPVPEQPVFPFAGGEAS